MKGSERVALNTSILYTKTVVNIVISLYSTRLILEGLGVKDYGIYNLIGGIVALLSFIKTSMSSSSQRFLSYTIGQGDKKNVVKQFNSNVILHFILGFLIVAILEIFGVPFLKTLEIPSERTHAAAVVYHLIVITTFFTINSVPYEGLLNAKENMLAFAILSIIESVAKLAVALILATVSFDKLIFYALATLIITLLTRSATVFYCKRKYEETSGNIFRDFEWRLVRQMFSFAGWNAFGALCSVGRSQGVAIVLNMFFGVVVNASYGIANQVNAQLSFFSQSMLISLRPQIIKSEGAGDRKKMIQLSMVASKFSFFLLSLVAIPVLIELPFILKIWLKTIPENTIMFCRLVIILNLVIQLSVGLMTAIQAVGKIKYYQSIVGSSILLSIPLGYVFFKFEYPPYSILVVAICVELTVTILRLFFAKHIAGIPIWGYIYNVIIKGLIPVAVTVTLVLFVKSLFTEELTQLFAVGFTSTLCLVLSIYFLGTDKFEKSFFDKIKITFIDKTKLLFR